MPTYVLLSTLTAEGSQTVHANPDRIVTVDAEVERFGCKVVDQYALLGTFDFLTIVEAPDNETVAHLAIDLGARGTVKVTSLPAMPVDALVSELAGPQQMGRP